MLIGEYVHTLDSKRRVSLPAKFRKALGKEVVITYGLDSCLAVYSKTQWEVILERLSKLSRGQSESRAFNRFLLSGAVLAEVDALGRVLIPETHATFAGLTTTVVLIGVQERVEAWSEERWKLYRARIAQQADVMAEKLGELGMY